MAFMLSRWYGHVIQRSFFAATAIWLFAHEEEVVEIMVGEGWFPRSWEEH